jgi:hypothetical protein
MLAWLGAGAFVLKTMVMLQQGVLCDRYAASRAMVEKVC